MQVRRQDVSHEMELRGTAVELNALAELIRSGDGGVELDCAGDPFPYDRKLSRVRIAPASGPAVIQCSSDSDVLYIRGGGAQFELLAVNLEGFADEGDALSHLHLDYFPGHDYLDESSEPLVIALAD